MTRKLENLDSETLDRISGGCRTVSQAVEKPAFAQVTKMGGSLMEISTMPANFADIRDTALPAIHGVIHEALPAIQDMAHQALPEMQNMVPDAQNGLSFIQDMLPAAHDVLPVMQNMLGQVD